MNTLLAYSSLTGNTKKLCSGVYEKLKNETDIEILTVKESKNLNFDDYDNIIVGFWIDKGTANKEARKFISKIKNKPLLFLATLGASPDSEHGQKVMKTVPTLSDESNQFKGAFLSRGKVDPKLTKRIKFLPLTSSIKQQMYDASISSREPNDEDIENGYNFVKKALSL